MGGNDVIVGFGDTGTSLWIDDRLGRSGTYVRPWHCIGGWDWDSTTPVSANVWTHLAYTWDSTTEYIYKNGQFTESRPRNFNYIPGQARIGNGWWGDPANAYPGLIDELKVFDRTLTAGEVESLFELSCPGKCKPCFPPPDEMVSWWPFNEDEGTSAEDIIGSNDGALHGALWAAGKAGNALSFDGTDDYVSTPDSPLWDLGGADFTLEAWVNPADTAGVNRLISAGGQNDGANNLWSFGYGTHADWGSGNRLSLDYYNGSGYTHLHSDEVKLGLGLWNHLAFVRSGASLSFYLNGFPAGSQDLGTVALGGGSTGAIIGARYLDGPSSVVEFANGLIDEVGLYQRALSAAEIAAIYAADCSGKCIPDTTSPEVVSIVRADPDPTNASSVDYSVAFTEPVAGVDVDDFNLTATAGPNSSPISSVIDSGDHTVFTVTVEIEPEFAAVRLNIVEPVTIADLSGNPLVGLPFFGETYTIDRVAPGVVSLVQTSHNPTNGGSVGYTLEFSEVVKGVDASDFELTTAGTILGASFEYIVEHPDQSGFDFMVDPGSGEGTIRLDIPLDAEITDLAGNQLSDLPFTSAEAYVVDRTAPYVVSITRLDPSPSFQSSVDYQVVFSEAVESLTEQDFYLTTTGTLGALPVFPILAPLDRTTWTVTVSTGTGSGTLRLNVHQDAAIQDLAGHLLTGLPYTGGENVRNPHRLHLSAGDKKVDQHIAVSV